ncbi:peptidoglycan D,D-transpeptidase FtsI family protein [Iamia sp.]|uniref:peptidoglycan D,D-transpeptidase FtsI family protein n=1 Tax=Iamia sp. TaxID=2722710 RepID=UPI002C709131|nr:penicillin-binding transpeptidase domain-containing protein [Iamia sp.]HXH56223.1 penicillin-binding transpeptidase domain-containing protein [Iamia sp.]
MTMDRQIKRLGIALVCCFAALFAQLNYIQFFGAERLNERPDNTRQEQRTFSRPRGQIIAADGTVLARSVEERSRFKFQRLYPEGDLFGPVTGYYSFTLGATGVERSYGADLAGTTPELRFASLSDLFVDREAVGNVHLTMHPDTQRIAREQLGDREGAVVALDPRSGAIDALWSFPSFDPGPLSTNTEASTTLKAALDADPERPLLSRAYRDIFFPGSTFKVVTGSVAVDQGAVTEENPDYPVRSSFDIDFTDRDLSNFGGQSCGGRLFDLLRVSCNSGFAQMGVDLGPEAMVAGAEAFGFNSAPPIDLPNPATSTFPTEFPDNEGNGPLARASIGQGDVSSSPLQMALVTAGIANDGSVMTPHVMDRVTDEEGEEVRSFEESEWLRAISPEAADVMRRGMVEVAANGTAEGLQIPGLEVGGKTGTAQLGTDPPQSHAWILGFAGPPGQPPVVAVAVMVQAQPGASEQTGGTVAAPIAKAVMEAVLATRGPEGGGG